MNERVIWALLATLGTWLLTALGAAVTLVLPARRRLTDGMLGFAAGVMIAASFWSLLQPAIQRASEQLLPAGPVAAAGFLTGAVFMWSTERLLHSVAPGSRRPAMLFLAVTLHNIPEGLAVGVAFGALEPGDRQGLLTAVGIALGIGLQNFPEGAAVALPLRREGISRWRSFLAGQASALVEPLAGILGALLVVSVEALLPWALAFAAGAMVLVAVHELIPECQQCRQEQPYLATGGIILGFTMMMLLDVMLG